MNASNPSKNSSETNLLSDERFLRKVATLYYEEEKTQEQIAEMFFCSRQTISKALQKARDKNIVQISVVPEQRTGYLQNLSRDLRLKLHLDDLILVPGSNFDNKQEQNVADGVLADITKSAANYLDELLTDDTILAISGGKLIMRSIFRALKPGKVLPNMRVISTMGFVRLSTNYGDPNLIAYDIATAYGAKHEWLPIPAIVETEEQRIQAQSLPLVRNVLQTIRQANVVVMGPWSPMDNHKLIEKGILTQQQVDILQKYEEVVDVNHWAFNAQGECINYLITPPPYYLTGLEVPLLKERIQNEKIKVILVAGASMAYIPGILATLKAGIANILITDHVTAELLAKHFSDSW